MQKISRRSFLAAGAAAAVSGSAVALSRPEAQAQKYQPPDQIPFSPKREEINRIIARDGKPRVVKAGDRVYNTVLFHRPQSDRQLLGGPG